MTDFYTGLADVATELLAPTSAGGLGQGQIVLIKLAPSAPPVNAWDPPSPQVPTRTTLNGAARGVGKELIGTPLPNGGAIVATDLQVIVAPWGGTADPTDVLELDGTPRTILRVDLIPAIGITSAVRLIVKG